MPANIPLPFRLANMRTGERNVHVVETFHANQQDQKTTSRNMMYLPLCTVCLLLSARWAIVEATERDDNARKRHKPYFRILDPIKVLKTPVTPVKSTSAPMKSPLMNTAAPKKVIKTYSPVVAVKNSMKIIGSSTAKRSSLKTEAPFSISTSGSPVISKKSVKSPAFPVMKTTAPLSSKIGIKKSIKKSIKTKVPCPKFKKSLKKGPKSAIYDGCKTQRPSDGRSTQPTATPNASPTVQPIARPTTAPTGSPVVPPTVKPTAKPSIAPTVSMKPTSLPTFAPTAYNCASPVGRSLDINNAVSSISNSVTPGTPQAKALSWLLHVDTTTNACNGLDKIRQRYSLAVFYYSTLGPNWYEKAYWLELQGECSWYGVTCTNGLVTSLFMDMNNLQGTLPTEVASLRSLSELHVYLNNIGGTLPTELGSLTSLSLLDLEVNHFEGKLFFDQLLNTNHTLQYLRGSDNQFVGSIPSWIGNLTGLQEFWAADNSLTGSIPTEITRLTDLVSWYVYKNKLNGTIPSSIGSLTNLEEMDISSNNLQGSIPNSIGNVAKLERLVITQNSLTGSIPTSLGNVTTLMDVYLNNNRLTGPVPAGFGSLLNLRYLLLNDNYLTGPLTEYVSPVLKYVDMSDNALDGGIPSSFFDLPSLTNLYLSNNTLTGTIPSSFGDSTTLVAIWLDGNKLNGTIPAVPTPNGWPKIKEVLLDQNHLTGSVPSSICDLRDLRPENFTTLHTDCEPPTLVLGQAQINCRNGCCTACSIGVLV